MDSPKGVHVWAVQVSESKAAKVALFLHEGGQQGKISLKIQEAIHQHPILMNCLVPELNIFPVEKGPCPLPRAAVADAKDQVTVGDGNRRVEGAF